MFKGIFKKIARKIAGTNEIVPESSTDYNAINANWALSYCDVRRARVLVVGCNTGKECSYFVTAGAQHVTGVDVLEETGRDYKHEKASYLIENAEDMPSLKESQFDLVYCHATLEHIPDINAAFKEMVRVCRKGGMICTIAAPLWHSAYGHHKKEFFEGYPWIHLCLSKDRIKDWFIDNMSEKYPPGTMDIMSHIDYMLDRRNMNQRGASEYLKVCNDLGVKIIVNQIEKDPTCPLFGETRKKLLPMFGEDELLGMTHRFVGIK